MLDLEVVIIVGALDRNESRKAHWCVDFPQQDDEKFLHYNTLRPVGADACLIP